MRDFKFRSVVQKSFLCVLLFGFLTSTFVSQAQQDERVQLEDIQQQLKEKKRKLEQLKGQENTILGELRTIELRLIEAQQKLEEYRQKLIENEAEQQQIKTNIARLNAQYAKQNATLAQRLRAIYKMGDLGYLTPLMAVSSHTDVQQQVTYLQRVIKSDKQLLKEAETHIQAILKEQDSLKKRQQEMLQAKQEIERQHRKILDQQQEKITLLDSLQTDKKRFAKVMQELEQSAVQLDRFLQNLDTVTEEPQQETSTSGPKVTIPQNSDTVVGKYSQHFRANKGKLLWPVQGQVITTFGNIRIGDTFTHYKGVDIRAKTGTPFYAVFQGTIKYADWFDGYGNLVIVDHGGSFYTLYAHADQILVKPGDAVETRQLLGKVGETDSIKGPHLYFEIRASGKPQNPQAWLAKLQ